MVDLLLGCLSHGCFVAGLSITWLICCWLSITWLICCWLSITWLICCWVVYHVVDLLLVVYHVVDLLLGFLSRGWFVAGLFIMCPLGNFSAVTRELGCCGLIQRTVPSSCFSRLAKGVLVFGNFFSNRYLHAYIWTSEMSNNP